MALPLRHPAVLTTLLLLSGLSAHAQIVLRRNEVKVAPFEISSRYCTVMVTAQGELIVAELDWEYGGPWVYDWRSMRKANVGAGEKVFMILQADNNLCIYKRSADGRDSLIWNSGIVEDPRIECVAEMVGPNLILRQAQSGGKVKWRKPNGL